MGSRTVQACAITLGDRHWLGNKRRYRRGQRRLRHLLHGDAIGVVRVVIGTSRLSSRDVGVRSLADLLRRIAGRMRVWPQGIAELSLDVGLQAVDILRDARKIARDRLLGLAHGLVEILA